VGPLSTSQPLPPKLVDISSPEFAAEIKSLMAEEVFKRAVPSYPHSRDRSSSPGRFVSSTVSLLASPTTSQGVSRIFSGGQAPSFPRATGTAASCRASRGTRRTTGYNSSRSGSRLGSLEPQLNSRSHRESHKPSAVSRVRSRSRSRQGSQEPQPTSRGRHGHRIPSTGRTDSRSRSRERSRGPQSSHRGSLQGGREPRSSRHNIREAATSSTAYRNGSHGSVTRKKDSRSASR
jgi:hypothetical protein